MKGRKLRFLLVSSVLMGILTIEASLYAGVLLPSYDPFSFSDDFVGPRLDSNHWTFIGSNLPADDREGTYAIQDSIVTLHSTLGGVAYLKHSFETFWPSGVKYGSWKGSISFNLRFDNLSVGSHALQLAAIDGGRVEVVENKFSFYDEATGTQHVLQSTLDNEWHLFEICFENNGRRIYWDNELVLSIPSINRFTYVVLGNTELDDSAGGCVSFDWFTSRVDHMP